MHERYIERFERYEARRQAFIIRIWQIPEAERIVRKNGAFNGMELIMHMALADGATNDVLDETPLGSYEGKTAKPTFIYNYIVGRMREGKSLPAPKEMLPKWVPGMDEAIAAWDKEQDRLRNHLNPARLGEPVGKFKMIGLLNADQIFDLMDAHLTYHDKRL
ncbi:MAG: hypothetical protein K8R88_02020 [Armatimonadetes bacterium]|nr:hypothetical protein [Armatimonadota bacterium]